MVTTHLMNFVKRVIRYLIKTLQIHNLIDSLKKDEHQKSIMSKVSAIGATFYEEAKVYNFQNEPKAIYIRRGSHIKGELLVFPYGGKIEVGSDTFIGEQTKIWSGDSVTIGNGVLISHNVNIIDTTSHELDPNERIAGFINIIKYGQPKQKGNITTAPITIKNNAWINFNCIILKGVTIGEGAIIAAGTVVTKDVPDYCLFAGNPGKVIRNLK